MLGFLKRKDRTPPEREGTSCGWCRVLIPAKGDQALFLAGAFLDIDLGWFCSRRCAEKYALRFRVLPDREN